MSSWGFRLVGRVVWWGVVLGALWAILIALIVGGSWRVWGLFDTRTTSADSDSYLVVFYIIVALVLWFTPRGILTGALCGFYAPASRSLNPFRSSFFLRVTREVMGWGVVTLLGSALAALTLSVATRMYGITPIQIALVSFLLFDLCGFGFVLWGALNRALRESRS